MGVFSRFRDIISSNINAMLERAEDPEKLIKLMIQEMEDTLVEMKASCANTMAGRTRVTRELGEARDRAAEWEKRARTAVEKNRDDLAREALLRKRYSEEEAQRREEEAKQFEALIEKQQSEIEQIEEKLATARGQYRVLLQRHRFASERKKAQRGIRRAETSDAFARFDLVQNRVDRLDAEGDLVNGKRKPGLEEEFARLETNDEIEAALQALKTDVKKGSQASGPEA